MSGYFPFLPLRVVQTVLFFSCLWLARSRHDGEKRKRIKIAVVAYMWGVTSSKAESMALHRHM